MGSNAKTLSAPTLGECIQRMKREILEDNRAGIVPDDCPAFSALHDHVDANYYGGFCEDDVLDALTNHFGGLDEEKGMPDDLIAFLNDAQNAIDLWIKEGGIQKEAPFTIR